MDNLSHIIIPTTAYHFELDSPKSTKIGLKLSPNRTKTQNNNKNKNKNKTIV